MSPIDWFKKEKPLLGLLGTGGGAVGSASGVQATGGTKSTNGSYTVHTFLGSGSLVIDSGPIENVEYLVVAGGGSGGWGNYTGGAGGGAGGVLSSVPGKPGGGPGGTVNPAIELADGDTYTMTVGDGGSVRWNYPWSPSVSTFAGDRGWQGENSSISGPGPISIVATGGGAGGGYNPPSSSTGPDWAPAGAGPTYTGGSPGGSGGGGGAQGPQVGGTGVPDQGYAGQAGGPSTNYAGGGGGGAGGLGHLNGPETPNPGPEFRSGGPGVPNNIDGTDYWYGGGGGGTGYTTRGGSGGKGGGGGGNSVSSPTGSPGGGSGRNMGEDGAYKPSPSGDGDNAGKAGANTGGGGGGMQNGASFFSPGASTNPTGAGNGGSGIIIVRYPT